MQLNMEKSEVVRLAVSAHERGIATGQFNLFTGELESLPRGSGALPEEAWLFDPDFGLVLTDDTGDRE